MASLQSIADRDDAVVVCRKPFSVYAGLDILLARIHGDGRFEVLSAAWEAALGFRCDELNGSSSFALLPFDEASARAWLRRITDPAEPEPLIFEVRCKGAAPVRMRWQSPDKKRDNASDSAFNAA